MNYRGMLPGGVFGQGQPYYIGMCPVSDTSQLVTAHGVVVNGRTADEAVENYRIAINGMPHRVILPGELRSVYFRMDGAEPSEAAPPLAAVPLGTAKSDLPSDAMIILLRTPTRGSVLVPPEGIEKLVE
ncbi:hypothetical protein HYY72_01765 [Candidatus Woesearchaeota archaeon]|nr:hypothetical protein [Candidatus Woesearchaeota archaeon]